MPSFPVNNLIGLAGASLRQVLDWRVGFAPSIHVEMSTFPLSL